MRYRTVVPTPPKIGSDYGISKRTLKIQCDCAGIVSCQYRLHWSYKRSLQWEKVNSTEGTVQLQSGSRWQRLQPFTVLATLPLVADYGHHLWKSIRSDLVTTSRDLDTIDVQRGIIQSTEQVWVRCRATCEQKEDFDTAAKVRSTNARVRTKRVNKSYCEKTYCETHLAVTTRL